MPIDSRQRTLKEKVGIGKRERELGAEKDGKDSREAGGGGGGGIRGVREKALWKKKMGIGSHGEFFI
jgi:hypothetical protein